MYSATGAGRLSLGLKPVTKIGAALFLSSGPHSVEERRAFARRVQVGGWSKPAAEAHHAPSRRPRVATKSTRSAARMPPVCRAASAQAEIGDIPSKRTSRSMPMPNGRRSDCAFPRG
jgi:hypothetical protein